MGRILVVDDVAAVRRAIARELREPGYAVATASTAREALRLFAPDLVAIVTDYELGEGSGLDLLETARDQCPKALRVLVTAARIDSPIERAVRDGLIEWLIEKPWRPGELANAVRRGRPRRLDP